MKKLFIIFLILTIILVLISVIAYVVINFKNDYIECTYKTKEISYGKVINEFPERTCIIYINHLFKKVYSPQDITIEGRLITDSPELYEIEKTIEIKKGYGIKEDSIIKTKIKIDRISGVYNKFSKLKDYENGNPIRTVEEHSNGYCKSISPKF